MKCFKILFIMCSKQSKAVFQVCQSLTVHNQSSVSSTFNSELYYHAKILGSGFLGTHQTIKMYKWVCETPVLERNKRFPKTDNIYLKDEAHCIVFVNAWRLNNSSCKIYPLFIRIYVSSKLVNRKQMFKTHPSITWMKM